MALTTVGWGSAEAAVAALIIIPPTEREGGLTFIRVIYEYFTMFLSLCDILHCWQSRHLAFRIDIHLSHPVELESIFGGGGGTKTA